MSKAVALTYALFAVPIHGFIVPPTSHRMETLPSNGMQRISSNSSDLKSNHEYDVSLFPYRSSTRRMPGAFLQVSLDVAKDKAAIVFMHWGDEGILKPMYYETVIAAAFFNPDVQVFLVNEGPSDGIVQKLQETCRGTTDTLKNMRIVDLNGFKNKERRESQFARNYPGRHCGGKDVVYEQACFQRFFWLNAFLLDQQLDRVLFLDADILVTKDLFQTYDMEGPYWSLFTFSSFFVMFTRESLDDFVGFLTQLYTGPVDKLVSVIEMYGDGRWTPSVADNLLSSATSKPKRHFSDMYALNAFVGSRPKWRRYVNNADFLDGGAPSENHVDGALHNVEYQLGNCLPVEWIQERYREQSVKRPVFEQSKLAGIHFQGHCKEEFDEGFRRLELCRS